MQLANYYNSLNKTNQYLANFYAQFNILPEKLNFKTSFGKDYSTIKGRVYDEPYYVGINQQLTDSKLTKTMTSYDNWSWDNVLTYKDKFGQHGVGAMVGYSMRQDSYNLLEGSVNGVPAGKEEYWYLVNGNKETATSTDGGTRYAHFQEGLTYVYDFVAPIHAGTVRVETNDNINYTFEINLIDDAEFEIRGLWDNKPVEYQYNPDDIGGGSGVDDVNAEGVKIAVMKDGDMIHILNAGNTEASIYDLDGRLLHVGPASQAVPVSSLGTGVRVIRVEGQTSKIIL